MMLVGFLSFEGRKVMSDNKKFKISYLSLICPFCDHAATFNTLGELFDQEVIIAYLTMWCPNCHEIVFVIYDVVDKKIENIYPKSVPKCDKRIPKKIADDFLEAKGCFGAGAYKGAVVMCRRAIQNTAIEKGAKKGNLFDQLNELVSKGIIPTSLEKLSHKIRSMGNYGAHPDEDGLDEVKEKDAKEILEFLEHFLTHIFVMPKRVEELEPKPEEEQEQ